jgi:hypothetical protein
MYTFLQYFLLVMLLFKSFGANKAFHSKLYSNQTTHFNIIYPTSQMYSYTTYEESKYHAGSLKIQERAGVTNEAAELLEMCKYSF